MVAQLYRENNPDSQVVMKRTDSIGISNYENFGECLFADEYNPQKGGEIMHGAHEQLRCLVWSGLTLKLKKDDKVLIDNVSGAAYTGRVLALMGPSGAGKTTLLNALGNRAPYGKISGDITYGREPFSTSDLYFVPQFDEVNNNLTVFEQIELVGLLKCRDKMDMYIRLQIVLRSLGLYEKSKSSCRDLTGGELKKVSVGMGMISNPKVLFLDEPTTGLDSTAAYSIVHHLVDLAKQLKIAVIMTIHQPAEMVFDMLQDLYIMETGRLAYYGPLACCSKYFKGHGYVCPPKAAMADFFLDMVSEPPKGLHQTSWQSLYLNSKFHENICREQATLDAASPVMTPSSPPPSGITRFHEIIKFFVKYYSRDYGFYYQRILCLCIIAIFSGTLFLQLQPKTANFGEYSGAIFFNMWTVLFSAVAATGLLARDRRQAVEQIKNAVISPSLYCLGQLVVSIPFNFVAALTFQSIFHWLTNINPNRESFIYSVLLTCGHLLLMEAFMLLVVEVLKNAMLCVTFAMIVMGWLFLFAGFFIKVSDMPAWIRWISFITPTKYSFDGYLFQIFHSQSFSVSGSSPEAFMSGDTVLETLFAQTGVKPWAMFGTLLAWVALIRIAHYGALLFQVRQFRAKRFSKE
jgi:ABC-type multidrug transport system ATPase subunit/ABC-type multidrug transport system permease subunit